MTKQGQFQVDNFDKFHNSDLGTDLERIITTAESLYENDESLSISEDNEESFDCPYGICVEGTSYWYANEEERNKDLRTLVDLVTNYCIYNHFIKNLTAKFYPGENMLELFEKGKLFHTETIENTEDHWFGIGMDTFFDVDFNFWEDDTDENRYVLTLYPIVKKDEEGFYSTDTEIFERIPLIIETK